MSQKTVVDFLERWQTGFLLVVSAAFVGTVVAMLTRSFEPPYGGTLGFVAGAVVTFLLLSYLLYGRR
ncbi:hypothetical protein [Haloarchaeobius sp. TZWWS8]|uniref:hypothetical protein n=1 Tax=Haloarchaeobius sp. TZWWS8 TaxID=3446121 RepID=UPI003EBB8998